jgi:enoyl-CoA hydratase
VNDDPLVHEQAGGVAVLRLNRPHVLNALDEALLLALVDAVEDARRDPATRCVLLTGTGRAFSTGADLTQLLGLDAAAFREYVLLLQRLASAMRRLDKPSLAAVNGYALAGGFELAVICDIRLAADTAVFGLPDTPLGLSPTSGMTYLLPRIVGLGWAKHLALTAETIDARQAERIGLVTGVVPAADLDRVARETARVVASHPPVGLRYTKLGFDLAADADLHTALLTETEAEVACFATEDVRRNLRAFAERKRQARPAGAEPAPRISPP